METKKLAYSVGKRFLENVEGFFHSTEIAFFAVSRGSEMFVNVLAAFRVAKFYCEGVLTCRKFAGYATAIAVYNRVGYLVKPRLYCFEIAFFVAPACCCTASTTPKISISF